MKTLKRRHARLCLAFLALMLVFGLLPLMAYRVLQLDRMLWAYLGCGGLIVCLALFLTVQSCCLRCPSCGRGLASPPSGGPESGVTVPNTAGPSSSTTRSGPGEPPPCPSKSTVPAADAP